MNTTLMDGIIKQEISEAVKRAISHMPIEGIIENYIMGYMDQAVSENYYLLSNRVADALASEEINLAAPIERAIMKALKGDKQ